MRKKPNYKFILALGAVLVTAASCSTKEQWKVSGTIDGAAGETIMLETVDNGTWYAIDSIVATDGGSFSFAQDRRAFPDIYRITIAGRSLYFPIDSTETVTVSANITDFDLNYKISGSLSADMMQSVNDKISEAIARHGSQAIEGDSILKRQVAEILQANWAGIVSYYAINKSVGDTPLFDPSRPFDRRIINAVANMYSTQRPNDPRTALLKNISLENRRTYYTGAPSRVYANEIPFMELSLTDKDGTQRSLTEEWEKGKTIILNFILLNVPEAPAYNIALGRVYDEYKDRGVEIFQVGCDEDEFAWRSAAKNLPWITVYNTQKDGASNLMKYNVTSIPATFVISADGNKMERVDNVKDLSSVVTKML